LPRGVDRAALNLVVITLDTTRPIGSAVRLPNAGTPNFDALAQDGVLFDTRAPPRRSPCRRTLALHRPFPPQHGVRDNGGYFLSDKEQTLAETLKAAATRPAVHRGLRARLEVGHRAGLRHLLRRLRPLEVQGLFDGRDQRRATRWSTRRCLDRPASGAPFFAWVHLYDAHAPYSPPEPFKSRYPNDAYQGEISFADSQVGRVVQFLRDRDLFDRTVIVVSAITARAWTTTARRARLLRLRERRPRADGRARAVFGDEEPARHRLGRSIDVMPTVLDLLGVPKPAGAVMDGASVTPLMTGARPDMGLEAYAEAVYPLHHFGWSDLRALRQGRYKLIAAPRPSSTTFRRSAESDESLRVAQGARRSHARPAAARWRRTSRRRRRPERSGRDRSRRQGAARRARLRRVVRRQRRRRLVARGLADPKTRCTCSTRSRGARSRQGRKRARRGDGDARGVLKEDPKVIDAWFTLGQHGRPPRASEEAIGHFKRALALKPDDEEAVINMAHAYRKIGRDDDALVGFRRFLELDPKNAQVHYEIAQIMIDRGDYRQAAAELRRRSPSSRRWRPRATRSAWWR
jgi:hypothetical protein